MPDDLNAREDRPERQLGHAGRDLAVAGGRDVASWYVPLEPVVDRELIAVDLQAYWKIIFKHKLVIGGALALTLAIGVVVTLLMTPIYASTATLQIDREAAKVVSGQDVEPQEQLIQGEEFFQTQYGLLRSRSLAERVMETLGLDRDDSFLRNMGVKDQSKNVAGRRNAVVSVLQDNLDVDPVRGSRLVKVSFNSPSPNLSAMVANSFAENFIGANLDRRFESSSYARDFLEKRIAQVKGKLEDSERQLVAYATAQQIINVNDGDKADPSASKSLAASDLQALNSSLASAKANRISAEEKWRQARSEQDYGTSEVLSSPTIQQLEQTRAKLSTDYQQKLSTYKPDFPEMVQLKAQLDETNRQLKSETQNIRSSVAQNTRTNAQAQYTIAMNEERALSDKVNQLKSAVLDLRDRSIQYNILQREVDTNRTLYDGLLQRYKEVGVAGGVTTNNISIVDRAEAPRQPSKPRPALNLAIAAVLGLGLGGLIAFLLEALDQLVRSPTDVEQKLGLPVLGTIPKLDKGVTPGEALADIRSPFSEAYFSLRTALQFSTRDGTPRSLLITSSRPGEGKSTSALAIAQNFARVGLRTILVDADLRNPSQHRNIGIDNKAGLTNLLTGAATLQEVSHPSDIPNFVVVTSGPLPPSPAELLASGRMRSFLEEAAREFDVLVIDGPPVMGLADAPMISGMVAGTLLVLESGVVAAGPAKATLRRLQMARARVIGAVLTKFNVKKANYGYGTSYEYQYAYGHRPTQLQKIS